MVHGTGRCRGAGIDAGRRAQCRRDGTDGKQRAPRLGRGTQQRAMARVEVAKWMGTGKDGMMRARVSRATARRGDTANNQVGAGRAAHAGLGGRLLGGERASNARYSAMHIDRYAAPWKRATNGVQGRERGWASSEAGRRAGEVADHARRALSPSGIADIRDAIAHSMRAGGEAAQEPAGARRKPGEAVQNRVGCGGKPARLRRISGVRRKPARLRRISGGAAQAGEAAAESVGCGANRRACAESAGRGASWRARAKSA